MTTMRSSVLLLTVAVCLAAATTNARAANAVGQPPAQPQPAGTQQQPQRTLTGGNFAPPLKTNYNTLAEALSGEPQLSNLFQLLNDTSTLSKEINVGSTAITLFAPINEAFKTVGDLALLPPGINVSSLAEKNPEYRKSIQSLLASHAVSKPVSNFTNGQARNRRTHHPYSHLS